jgi:NAD(P)-dependent dehydrogenase (short-subunit alcohol dehydrogenase family)
MAPAVARSGSTSFVGSASGHPAYHASKGAVRIYSKAAAVRYGPLGVRVNTVHPGYMPPMLNATNAGERDDKIALTPLRRIGKPIEVAYGVVEYYIAHCYDRVSSWIAQRKAQP